MLSSLLDSENVAVIAGSSPPPTKSKLRPLAGIEPAVPIPGIVAEAPLAPAVRHHAAPAAPAAIRSTIFSAEARPTSPWAAEPARAPRPMQAQFLARPAFGTPAELPDADGGIEGVRALLFGRHMSEMQTKVAELQLALSGEMKRLREALMGRVDEMAGYLHRDMVVLRDEMQREMALLKTDLFTAATGLSGVKDRLHSVESESREETKAALAEIEDRVTRQESAFASVLDHIEIKLGAAIQSKCSEALAICAKKSDVAELLTQMGTLVAQESQGVELGWFSVECAPPAAPASSPAAESEAWTALAQGNLSEPPAAGWPSSVAAFVPNGGLIT